MQKYNECAIMDLRKADTLYYVYLTGYSNRIE